MYCKKCLSKNAYKQLIDFVYWIICPDCGYKERLKQYFYNDKQ